MTKPSSPSPALDALVTAARGRLARKRPLLIAIDGRSGSGKSTLAEAAAKELAATIVVADDFYSGGADAEWASVSVEERVDRVIDWRRLRRSALEPLLGGEAARWHPLDFEPGVGWIGWKNEEVTAQAANVIILDGAYSARAELEDMIDLAVLVEAPEKVRRRRLVVREGREFMTRWHELWDEPENLYFGDLRPAGWLRHRRARMLTMGWASVRE